MVDDTTLYVFRVKVTLPNKKKMLEVHKTREKDSRLGSCIAVGKVVKYYETLKQKDAILDYHIMF